MLGDTLASGEQEEKAFSFQQSGHPGNKKIGSRRKGPGAIFFIEG
jgi:hypothetical protein